MPTGYTAIIGERDDLTFREFVLRCARAMGACIMQRDDPIDDIPIFDEKPSDYHEKALAAAKAELERYATITIEAAKQEQDAELARTQRERRESVERSDTLRRKYNAMFAEVRRWTPPTPDHDGLKAFMQEQITESLKWDCSDRSYFLDAVVRLQVPVGEWIAAKIAAAKKDVAYHTREYAEEVERVNRRNEWKRQLVDSLPTEQKGAD